MNVRFASGLFRLWVVLTMLWLAAAGVYIVVSYQTVPQHALIKGRIAFDDLIPAYEHCWKSSDGKEVNIDDFISDKDFAQIAECEGPASSRRHENRFLRRSKTATTFEICRYSAAWQNDSALSFCSARDSRDRFMRPD